MNKKYLISGIVTVAVIAVIITMFCLWQFSPQRQALLSGKNGIYNPITGNCEPTAYTQATFTCCFDVQKYQIDCDNPLVKLGPQALAIYQTPPAYTSRAGYLSVMHGLTLTNNGNTVVDGWIQSVSITNSPTYAGGVTALTSAYTPITGIAYKKSINPSGGSVSWSSSMITLDNLAPTGVLTPTKYTVTYVFNATNSTLGIWGTDTEITDFNVTKEYVSISGGVSLG